MKKILLLIALIFAMKLRTIFIVFTLALCVVMETQSQPLPTGDPVMPLLQNKSILFGTDT